MKFIIGTQHLLRDGSTMTIVSINTLLHYPIRGLVTHFNGAEEHHRWPSDNNGRFYQKSLDRECPLDIMTLVKACWEDI